MKRKKSLIYVVSVIALVVVLMLSLTACLKIGMQKKQVRDRLTQAGAQVTDERSAPMVQGVSGLSIESILLAKLTVTDIVDGEEVELSERAYVFFAKNVSSADTIEKSCKAYLNDNQDTIVHWNVYRFEETIVCGHYKIVNVVRQY